MSKKRVSLLTVNSVTTLTKVCSSCKSSDSINALKNLKYFSTSIERSDFQNVNNAYEIESSSDYHKNLNGNGPRLNYSEGFKDSSRDSYVKNPVGANRSFDGIHGQNSSSLPHNTNRFDQNYAGGNRDRFVYGNQNAVQNGNSGEYHGQTNRQWQQSPSLVYPDTKHGVQQNWNGQSQNWNGVNTFENNSVHQNGNSKDPDWYANGLSQPNSQYQPLQSQGNQNWNYTPNATHFQQSSIDYNSRNPETYGAGQYQQNVGQYPTNFSDHENQVNSAVATESKSPEMEYSENVEKLNELCKEGKVREAVEVLCYLADKCFDVDLPTLLQLMHTCGEVEALEEAKSVHEHIIKVLSHIDVSTYNKIIEMYAKCNSIDDAIGVFNKMPERNLETWDTMIRWLAKTGCGEDAIDMFTRFKETGERPNGQLFIGVFSVCAALGDINEGLLHFKSMCKDYGIVPSMEHYVALVDMIATTGYLDEALEFIENMPVTPTVDVWETLMKLSRVHGNMELGDRCAEIVEQLDSSRLDEQSKAGLIPIKASDILKAKQKKASGNHNPLDIRSRTYEYRAGDTSHPENDRIYALLRGLKPQMIEMGYKPETRFVLHDIDQESKEEALLSHSERLAFSHGLITTSARSSIRVIKNLRVCVDCHNALKIISKIVGREFIMRDAKRFHHLKDGVCSCRDYW